MNTLINYFETVPSWHNVLLFCFFTFLFWNIENLKPIHKQYNKWKHALYNILFMVIVTPVQLVMGYFVTKTVLFVSVHQIGILQTQFFEHKPFLLLIVGFIMLDLGEYFYHFQMHKFKRLWLFHAVHHMEENVDVSTTLREHPAETGIRLAFLMVLVVVTGIPIWALLFRQFVQIGFTLFSHSNFKFNKKVNNILTLVFITPNLHHVHHHFEQPFTDTNYGDVLSIWDRLFGTFYNGDLKIEYGIDTFKDDARKNDFKYLFLLPFMKIDHPSVVEGELDEVSDEKSPVFGFAVSRTIKSLVLILVTSLLSVAAKGQSSEGDAILGRWISEERDLEVEVYKVGDAFYGKIVWFACNPAIPPMEDYLDDKNSNKALRSRHWLGMNTLLHLEYAGNNKWDNGSVYQPDSGTTYSANASLVNINKITVRGYMGFQLLGKTLTFIRVKK